MSGSPKFGVFHWGDTGLDIAEISRATWGRIDQMADDLSDIALSIRRATP